MFNDLYFVIRHNEVFERIYRVESSETTIGRTQQSTLCLPHPAVSRKHAILVQTRSGLLIRDLGSRNGTLLNHQPVDEAIVWPATVLEIGPYSLKAYRDFDAAMHEAADEENSTMREDCHRRSSAEESLTQAQRRVYDELIRGKSEKEAAGILNLSVNTVHTHSRAIYRVFNVSSRAELLARAVSE